jgi:cellulose synthase/poly-beta-1,6-N-acetylglucosamine synthase-like glycosyltransferase
MLWLIFIICGLYLIISVVVWLGLFHRAERSNPGLTAGSVVICGRDEERDLPACLASIEAQDLDPAVAEALEVILVDDASRDRTGELMEAYARTSRFTVRVLHMPPPQPGEKTGKWRPLKEGLKLASREGLLLSDADAVLPPRWVREHLRCLGAAQVVAGFARLTGEGLWGRVQSLDWFFLLGVGSGMNRWGVTQAALGKNLSVRKTAYDAVGGLEGIGFSLTEDQAIVQALARRGGKMLFPLEPEMMVDTSGVHTWNEFVSQRRRWATGIRRLTTAGKFCIYVMALRQMAVVAGLLAGWAPALWAWAATAAVNFLILGRVTAKLGQGRRLFFFPLWEIFYTWSAPVQAAFFLGRRGVEWKGRRFANEEKKAALTTDD